MPIDDTQAGSRPETPETACEVAAPGSPAGVKEAEDRRPQEHDLADAAAKGGVGEVAGAQAAVVRDAEAHTSGADAPPDGPAQLATHHANGLVDQTSYMPVKQILVVMLSMQLAVLLSFLEQTIVSTALPTISAAFDDGRSSAFVPAMYLLTSTALQPVWGRLSDIFGRKYTLLACMSIFIIGSLGCAVAQTMLQLIVLRGLQGAGGGGLLTLVLIIVSDIISLKDRGKWQGVTEATILVGNAIGPLVGGAIAQHTTWRWVFWLNLPGGGLAILVMAFFLPLKAVKGDVKQKLRQIDYGGALLTCFATVLVILPLNWGGTSFDWVSGPVLGCLLSGVVLFGVFILYEWKVAKIPVVPPFIFKNVTVSAIFFTTFINGACILTQVYYLPQYLQVARGYSPTKSGALIIPQLATTTIFVFFSGQLVSRVGEYKPSICVGYAIWAVGLGLLSTLDEKSSIGKIIGFQLVNGAGQGQTLQTSLVAAQAAVARSEISVVTSVRNFMRSLGGTVFLVIAAAILNNTLRSQLTSHGFDSSTISTVIDDPASIWTSTSAFSAAEKTQIILGYVQGFHTLFHVLCGVVGLDFIVAVLFIKRHSLSRGDEEALKQRGKEWVSHRKEKKRAKHGGDAVDQAEKGEKATQE
ncbi:hypothetical protein Rhopal_000515-T1 [Rhodotorula paludigena]|uniref:Major facilitator superfamily (MFS) profile domain-containing protein n=1 Tax=Rhodotorula paludigena TaxID=86838 RepID=A0AAV5G519_9BASI|nr:hypothetical protein Rhopal_000515-T1 [Rhodotorula paludigena]